MTAAYTTPAPTNNRFGDGMGIYVTPCAVEKARAAGHPIIGTAGVRSMLSEATELGREAAADLLDRPVEELDAIYLLTRNLRGVLVIGERPDRVDPSKVFRACLTYIDLDAVEQHAAERAARQADREATRAAA